MKSPLVTLCALVFAASYATAEPAELNKVQARSISIQVPGDWVVVKPKSESRVAQFSIPGDPSDADMVVFYFGGPTGGVKANVERWIGQFEKAGLKLNMFQGECAAGTYILIDTQGTWNKPDGPPFARKTIATPNSRALNVIITEQKDGEEDFYFIKLS